MHMFKINYIAMLKYVAILSISILLSYCFRVLTDYFVELYPEHTYWIEKLILLVFGVFFLVFVLIPFAKLLGIKIVK